MKAKCMSAFLLPTSESYRKYFSDEVCDSLELIEADYGLKGFAVVIKLWQKIYGSNEGYYCRWDDKVCSLFAKRIGAGKGLVLEIVNRMIKDGIFDADLYQKYNILTSEWIQQNWVDYMKRRPGAKIENSYLLVSCTQNQKNVCKNSKNVYKNEKNPDKNVTTEQNLTEQNLTEQNLTELYLSDDSTQLLTQNEFDELAAMSSARSVEKYIGKIIDWQSKTNKHCRNPFETIKKWIAQDKLKQASWQAESKPSYDLDEYMEYAMNFSLSGGEDKK